MMVAFLTTEQQHSFCGARLDKSAHFGEENISQPKHMLWVPERAVSMRRIF